MSFFPYLTSAQAAYEATPAFRQYWAAMQEEQWIRGVFERYEESWPLGSRERHHACNALRASADRVCALLQVCQMTPEHRAAFGW